MSADPRFQSAGASLDAIREAAEAQPVAVTTIIVGGAPLVGAALACLLDRSGVFEIVAFADGEEEAARYANGHKPQLALIGPYVANGAILVGGHGYGGLVTAIKDASEETRVCMVVDVDAGVDAMVAGLDAGAHGLVAVDSSPSDFIRAALDVANEKIHIPAALAMQLVSSRHDQNGSLLSPRETEVVRHIALGYTNTEIANLLFLSVRTIESHRANIASKLGSTSRSELVRWAIDNRLLS